MECNISYVAYEYTNATVSGNSFSFGKTRMVDLKWDVDYDKDHPLDLRPLISTSTKDDIPTLYSNPMDEAALADFIGSETFRLEYIKGDRGYVPHGLSAMLGGEVNISQRFDNMASSMTEYLRSGPNTQLAKGNQIEPQNYVVVNWYWLIGPAILELAALIFAICTIVSNARKHKVPLWKSSALVLLTCQHDEDEGLIRGTTETVAELEQRAKSSRAKLE
ncbi:hypothetical protein NW752_002497 [Fusarium irregulare]|uniref:Uncharacterized protein n=1 Tax=Fusarium irregulare TaxID=2494466 RepID=A0A9W8PD80_9HYPO|nr:hypothetical protein NW766_012807 [Fusarium irregulare]KAJ4025037.1 hypothetical protein NW752_002497 [Fusarium irregulare]